MREQLCLPPLVPLSAQLCVHDVLSKEKHTISKRQRLLVIGSDANRLTNGSVSTLLSLFVCFCCRSLAGPSTSSLFQRTSLSPNHSPCPCCCYTFPCSLSSATGDGPSEFHKSECPLLVTLFIRDYFQVHVPNIRMNLPRQCRGGR